MEDDKDFITDESSINFDVIIKNQKDIIDDMCFESEKDKNLCFDIIKNLEETAAKCIKERKNYQKKKNGHTHDGGMQMSM